MYHYNNKPNNNRAQDNAKLNALIAIVLIVSFLLSAITTKASEVAYCMPLIDIYNVNGSTDQGAYDWYNGLALFPDYDENGDMMLAVSSYEDISGTVAVTISHPEDGEVTREYELTYYQDGIYTAMITTMYIAGDGEVNQMMYSDVWSIAYATTQINIDATNCHESEKQTYGYEAVTEFLVADSLDTLDTLDTLDGHIVEPVTSFTLYLPVVTNQ